MSRNLLAVIDQKYSITFIGVIVLVLSQVLQRLNIVVASDALTITIETLVFIVGALLALWGRWRKGDINLFGVKK